MSLQQDFTIAICGAGLAGLTLALALQSRGIRCTIYEAADTPERRLTGSLSVAPNGQSVLDELDLWRDLALSSKFYRYARILNSDGELLNQILLGDTENFGFESMRIVRKTLVIKLAEAVRSGGTDIICNKKFMRVVTETKSDVTIEFADGTTTTASLLIGADGIYSRVRKYLHPDVDLQYIGSVAVGGSVSASKISNLPEVPYGLHISAIGSAMIGSHVPDDTDYIAFVGKPHPDLGREEWKHMFEKKEKMRQFLADGQDRWPPYVQSAIENIREDELWLWPMYVLPEVECWNSQAGRVLLIGDAAHAMPPTAGQGANMAFEDAYTLGFVLGLVDSKISVAAAFQFWQGMRKNRIRLVLEMSMQWAKMRDPPGTKNAASDHRAFKGADTQEGQIEQMRWIYGGLTDQQKQIECWAAAMHSDAE